MNPDQNNPDQAFQELLAKHNYKPTPTSTGWYNKIASAQPVKQPGAIFSQFSQGLDQMKQAGSEIFSGQENPIQAAESGLKAESGLATAVTSPLAPVLKPAGDVINWLGEKIGSTQAAQDFVSQHPDAADALQRIATDASNAGNVAGTITGAEGVAKGIPKVVDATKTGLDAIKPDPAIAETAAKTKLATQVQGVADEWAKPTTVSKASYNNARAVLEKDPAIPKFLAEQKVNPWQHIDKSGNYETADTAQALRDTAAKMSKDTLRPSLQMADYSTPKTSVGDLANAAVKNLEKDKSLTAGERESVISNITKEAGALNKAHPDGLSLENMHDSKITYAGKGGYSPIKSAADNNTATANRALASAFADTVDKKFPGAKDFNAYLSKYYKAADYLDALNTKKAPTTLLQNIAHRGAEVVGAAVGHGIGGGILGGVGGYVLGGALEHALENMTNASRGSFLSNLEITNPEAFTKVQAYLKAQNSGANGVLRLPSAGPETPIPLGADSVTPAPSVAPYAAKTKLPTANPKTGRMQRTYTSDSK